MNYFLRCLHCIPQMKMLPGKSQHEISSQIIISTTFVHIFNKISQFCAYIQQNFSVLSLSSSLFCAYIQQNFSLSSLSLSSSLLFKYIKKKSQYYNYHLA